MKRAPTTLTAPRKKTPKASSAARPARAAAKKPVAPAEPSGSQLDPAVIVFMRALAHPLKHEVEAIRQLILAASPEVREGIKWNAPSFRTKEYFATFNLRTKDRIRLILHTGAKVKESATKGTKVADPAGLLEWLAPDRCLVTIRDATELTAKRTALRAILQAWIREL